MENNKKQIILVGNGMTGYKFCEKFIENNLSEEYSLIVYGEEPHVAYDRVHLTSYYTGTTAEELQLAPRNWYDENNIQLNTNELVIKIDRNKKSVTTSKNNSQNYDILVLATGSSAFVPPIQGKERHGVFVYRTLEDLDAIKSYAKTSKRAAVIGGGLLGLEAAKAVHDDGLETSIIEFAPRLMPRQLDKAGSDTLKTAMENLNLQILLNKNTKLISGNGHVEGMIFSDGSTIETDMVIISAGIKPRDELATSSQLDVGERGGIVVNNQMQTSDPDIYAIGECALANNMIWGLVAPCYDMAEVAIRQILGQENSFKGADLSTKLKLIGTDVASFGDALGEKAKHRSIVYSNTAEGIYKRINISEDGKELLGGILVGDASDYNGLLQVYKNKLTLPKTPEILIIPNNNEGGIELNVLDLPDEATICSCENITKGNLVSAISEFDLTQLSDLKVSTKAGTGCGGCMPMLDDILTATLKQQGKEVKKTICEHFEYTRQELYDLIKVNEIKSFSELIKKFGTGDGCEICKPLGASLLASIWNGLITKQAEIQDTNDKFLANIQRGGTYSVVPRIAGGEITPDKLITIGQVSKKYDLYLKITGGQRIDMFGARVDQLPDIWEELIEAGFESGHAYGKSIRTVKSCVGSAWCRYGQQDSVSFAIEVEERYKGIRSPHKLKGGVSGCIRECAEARSKDFGIIATEKGWNLYVGGNGGANPVHAQLLAADIDSETCIKYIDRYLLFYIKTAEPLTRTAKWLTTMDGGLEYLKEVIIEDKLGICSKLEKEMSFMVETYKCEWAEVVKDPELRKRFKHFANSNDTDDNIKFEPFREQKKPIDWKKETKLEF